MTLVIPCGCCAAGTQCAGRETPAAHHAAQPLVARVAGSAPCPVEGHAEGRQAEIGLHHLQRMARRAQRRAARHHHRESLGFEDGRRDVEMRAASGGCAAPRPSRRSALRRLSTWLATSTKSSERSAARSGSCRPAGGRGAAAPRSARRADAGAACRAGPTGSRRRSRCGLPRAPRRWRRAAAAAPRRCTPGASRRTEAIRRQELLGADVAHVHRRSGAAARRVEAVGLVDRQLASDERRLDLAREARPWPWAPRRRPRARTAGRARPAAGVSAWLTAGCDRTQRVGGAAHVACVCTAWKT